MFLRERRNKYNAKSSIYNGRSYHSKFEASVAQDLDIARKATLKKDRVVEIIPQYPIDLKVYGKKICRYYADFYVKYADDHIEIIEVKGFETEIFKLKWKLFEAIYEHEHPNIVLRIIK